MKEGPFSTGRRRPPFLPSLRPDVEAGALPSAWPRPSYTQSSPSDDTWTMFVSPMAGSGSPAVMTIRVPGL